MEEVVSFAPGRLNIIGEHTDYNGGWVLPAAIDLGMEVSMKKIKNRAKCRLSAKNLDETFEFDLDNFQRQSSGWANYILGIVAEYQLLGCDLGAFEAEFKGNIPIGSGLSSSAGLECSFALALNELFGCKLDKWAMIKASQRAEHQFVGTKCGIMDQFASVMGQSNNAMLLDCRSLEFEYIPVDLQDYSLLLLNTNVSHSLADSAYNARRESCEKAVQYFSTIDGNIKQLRDVNLSLLMNHKDNLDEELFRRCRHIVTENVRVERAAAALKQGKCEELGSLMYLSHESLTHDYEVSCEELDFMVEYARSQPEILGSRMMGGGFGGCTINLIQTSFVDYYIDDLSNKYRAAFDRDLTPIKVSIGQGATIKDSKTTL